MIVKVIDHGQEIAARGLRAVEELREKASWLERKILFRGHELIDLDSTPAGVKHRIMCDCERITKLFHPLWTRRIGSMIVEARRTRRGKPVRVLDIGSGHGALLFAIGDWARKKRIPVELHGIEVDTDSLANAQRLAHEEGRRIDFRAGDSRDLALDSGSVDVAVCTFVLHHLAPGDVARTFAEMDRVAAVNTFIFDIRRSPLAVPGIWALVHAVGWEAPSRHDAIASVRRGYTVAEIEALFQAARVGNTKVTAIPPAFYEATRA